MAKEYLGDGVYIEDQGYHVVLTTEDGISVTNRIFMDRQVEKNLRQYMERLRRRNGEEDSGK